MNGPAPLFRRSRSRRGRCRPEYVAAAVLAFAVAGIVPLRADEPGRWAVSIDNDAFTGATEDRDYTAGFSAALVGAAARRYVLPSSRALEWLDRRSRAARLHRVFTRAVAAGRRAARTIDVHA